jgi:hypothetical protein
MKRAECRNSTAVYNLIRNPYRRKKNKIILEAYAEVR